MARQAACGPDGSFLLPGRARYALSLTKRYLWAPRSSRNCQRPTLLQETGEGGLTGRKWGSALMPQGTPPTQLAGLGLGQVGTGQPVL